MKKILKEYLPSVIGAIVLAFFLQAFILFPCVVDGTSMDPNLKNNDFGYSFKISKLFGINRFDIVVISVDDVKDKMLVKRVIGLPNETIKYENNKLYVNGEYIEEPFINNKYTNDFSYTLGDNEYFCLGDNRDVSRDSRYYGPFSIEDIISVHVLVVYPLSNFGYNK